MCALIRNKVYLNSSNLSLSLASSDIAFGVRAAISSNGNLSFRAFIVLLNDIYCIDPQKLEFIHPKKSRHNFLQGLSDRWLWFIDSLVRNSRCSEEEGILTITLLPSYVTVKSKMSVLNAL